LISSILQIKVPALREKLTQGGSCVVIGTSQYLVQLSLFPPCQTRLCVRESYKTIASSINPGISLFRGQTQDGRTLESSAGNPLTASLCGYINLNFQAIYLLVVYIYLFDAIYLPCCILGLPSCEGRSGD
jgi:hypothetical protein